MKLWDDTPIERLSEEYVKPHQYLEFAQQDLMENNLKGYVNALGNIKRAIEAQLDINLDLFLLLKRAEKKSWSFPEKCDILKEIGFSSPNILTKINKKRNALEHYHKKPSKEDVTDYYDIAQLFLEVHKNREKKYYLYFDFSTGSGFRIKQDKLLIYEGIDVDANDASSYQQIVDGEFEPTKEIEFKNKESWIKICKTYILPAYS